MQFLTASVTWQRSTVPPVRLVEGFFLVRVEGDRVTGLGVGETADSAVDDCFERVMVEA
jgi:hypothetical protein